MRPKQPLPLVLVAGLAVVATLWPATALAQRRGRARPAAVRQAVVVRAPTYRPYYRSYYRPYYSPYYRSYIGLSFAYGYPGPFYAGYGYPWGFYPGYGYYAVGQSTGSVRVQVEPRQTEVYADGYYVGIADDYDGVFQRLRLPPGAHEIELYLEGHRSARQTLYLTPGTTVKVQHRMEPLGPGDASEPRPEAPAEPPPAEAAPAAPTRPTPPRVAVEPSAFGTLAIRVQPPDAEILIDGEPWQAPAELGRLVVQVAEGRHQVEVRKVGYEIFTTEIEVRRGETVPLNVSLLRRD